MHLSTLFGNIIGRMEIYPVRLDMKKRRFKGLSAINARLRAWACLYREVNFFDTSYVTSLGQPFWRSYHDAESFGLCCSLQRSSGENSTLSDSSNTPHYPSELLVLAKYPRPARQEVTWS